MKRNKNDFSFSLSNVFDEETEMFPLMSNEDEEQINKEETPNTLPILPLRNTVLFPGVIIPITIGETMVPRNNPNLNQILFKGVRIFEFSIPKAKNIIEIISDQCLRFPPFSNG